MLTEFLKQLLETGRCKAPYGQLELCAASEISQAKSILTDFEADYRSSLPFSPPDFIAAEATVASVNLYYACQFMLKREIEEAKMEQFFASEACHFSQATRTAELNYSTDVVLRFLPDLFRLAQAKSKQDALLVHLRRWGKSWPLSSIGMGDDLFVDNHIQKLDLAVIEQSEFLARLYLDRILQRQDESRILEPWVRRRLQAELGLYPKLAGKIGEILVEQTAAPTTERNRQEL